MGQFHCVCVQIGFMRQLHRVCLEGECVDQSHRVRDLFSKNLIRSNFVEPFCKPSLFLYGKNKTHVSFKYFVKECSIPRCIVFESGCVVT